MMRSGLLLLAGLLMTLPQLPASAQPPAYPPLPEAVSSFGGIVADNFLYVYGGHTGKAHSYSTSTVSGKLHRLDLKHPKAWEELPGGVGLQGMNLAAHAGKIYLIGGMQPRNKPGDPAENHSVADVTCYGIDGDEVLKADFASRRASGERLLKLDPLSIRHRIPRGAYVWAYEHVLPLTYRLLGSGSSGIGSGIDESHFFLREEVRTDTPVLFAVARRPRTRSAT